MTTTLRPAMTAESSTTASGTAVPAIIIGLDIGGTKTHGLRLENGRPVADKVTGSANVQNVSRESAQSSLAELFKDLGHGTVERVYVGAGGVDTKEDADELAGLIAPFAPHAKIRIVHDSRLLLAAGGADTGVAVIAGTGSAVWGRNRQGTESRAGGWGYLLGDEGSGYWLGREAVRHSLEMMNREYAPDELTRALLAACDVDHPNRLIALFHSPDTGRQYWARHAQLVVAAAEIGHKASQLMLEQAGHHLARMTVQALTLLGIPGPVILGGGLGMNSTRLQSAFRKALASSGIHDVRIVDQDPVYGTKQLAKELG
jgi:glucosamine kinase